jgi:RNA polymerase sigma factor (sigma-70 family)
MAPDESIRLLHAAYAAPHDGVTDAELLRRCAGKDDAAFELLMRRHADMVWRVCRSVVRDSHSAEDAFQATFLLVARNAGAFAGRGTAAGWLYRIARHAALKARARGARSRPADVDLASVTVDDPSDPAHAELAPLLHEELGRLSEKYRAPLVLCYLEGLTHVEAARRLGWPVGTVATRVARGRDRLRDRLTRRGVSLSAGGVAAALTADPAMAVPPAFVSATVGATFAGRLSPAVLSLARGVQAVMTRTRLAPLVALVAGVALAAGTVLALGGSGDPKTPAPPPTRPEAKEALPVDRTLPAGPGVQALAAASTDIVVVEVLETNPEKAIEGARDTVRLKVARTLLGRLAPGDTFGVYYHLLWSDERREIVEPPKFQKGKRYLVFLRSHIEDRGGAEGKRMVYELTDQWLSVQLDHAGLVKSAAAAVRTAHGDAQGEWSEPVGPLQGRLILVRDHVSKNGTPIIVAYLDLQNVAGGDNTVEFNLEKATKTWTVTDEIGKEVAPTPGAGNWAPTAAQKPTLPAGASARLTLTISGAGIMKDRDGHLELGSEKVWVFPRGGGKTYYLRGKIEVKPTGDRSLWSGTLELPRVRIPTGRE